ncbi:MAG: HAD family hydrolase [archaeon]
MKEKQIIAVDFDGALLKSRPFNEAHKRWFYLMSILLKDDSINKYASLENYFDKVHEVMKRYLGNVDEETRTIFARSLYAMVTIAEVKKEDLISEFVQYLKSIKSKYKLALITTAPESSVEPILKKLDCFELFDIIYKSPVNKQPNKKELFEEFIKKYGKPIFYIGKGDKDIITCKDLGIKSISVSWVSKGQLKGDYDIKTVKELKDIIE